MPVYKKPLGALERFFVGLLVFAMAILLINRGYKAGQFIKKKTSPTEKTER